MFQESLKLIKKITHVGSCLKSINTNHFKPLVNVFGRKMRINIFLLSCATNKKIHNFGCCYCYDTAVTPWNRAPPSILLWPPLRLYRFFEPWLEGFSVGNVMILLNCSIRGSKLPCLRAQNCKSFDLHYVENWSRCLYIHVFQDVVCTYDWFVLFKWIEMV